MVFYSITGGNVALDYTNLLSSSLCTLLNVTFDRQFHLYSHELIDYWLPFAIDKCSAIMANWLIDKLSSTWQIDRITALCGRQRQTGIEEIKNTFLHNCTPSSKLYLQLYTPTHRHKIKLLFTYKFETCVSNLLGSAKLTPWILNTGMK